MPTKSFTTFDDDLAFLRKYGEVQLLTDPSGARVAASALYQGRVMTSAVASDGRSLGWIHRKFITEGKSGTPFDNYGGEDRFWLGPEGGQYGLYFPPGKPFDFASWQTPAAFQQGAWKITGQSESRVAYQRAMTVTNYAGTELKLEVRREIALLSATDLGKFLRIQVPDSVKWVAYHSKNEIENTGAKPWTERTGLVSAWILGMYPPAADAFVIIPFEPSAKGAIVNDQYFGKVPQDRLVDREHDGYLVFKCDGQHRSKIGLGPTRAKSVLGSYSAASRLLTIVHYDKPKGATRYVNSMWEKQKAPYGGDVVNSYNDGSPGAGKPPLGGFYELETSSPAAALKPGATSVHTNRTFHFVGSLSNLNAIARATLGVGLRQAATDLLTVSREP